MAGFEVFGLIGTLFAEGIGSPLLSTLLIVAIVWIVLASLRAPVSVQLAVLTPLLLGIALNSMVSDLLTIPAWVVVLLFTLLGFVFSGLFLVFVR